MTAGTPPYPSIHRSTTQVALQPVDNPLLHSSSQQRISPRVASSHSYAYLGIDKSNTSRYPRRPAPKMSSPLRGWGRGSGGLSESSDLLSNECSTPIRTSSPLPDLPLDGDQRAPYVIPTPSYTAARVRHSPLQSPRASMDPRTLSPHSHLHPTRRPSNASLLRSRSVAQDEGDGSIDRSRLIALIAVCTLSIGSHFTMYLMGPLKSRMHREMGSSNAQFSLLVSALSLNSTWTPLVGGILVARFGTAVSSVATTGAVFIGALILYIGVVKSAIVMMAFGLFLFGIGMTPLMVVQETLLARLSPGGHLGLSLALGLVSGKSASFIASFVSLPLAEWGGDTAPFIVALFLCVLSFGANSARLLLRCGERRTRDGEEVSPKRVVKWQGVSRLGDVFWLFIVLNLFCGAIWQPFLHLAANVIQVRFGLSESKASLNASVLLAGAIVLYPIIGYVTDRYNPQSPRTTFLLFQITSILTLFAYVFLCLPVSITRTPWPALLAWALGHGASTLLLVVMVARILPPGLVPLGLGIHKALEVCASTTSQTLAGLWLDWAKDHTGREAAAAHSLLVIYALLNVIQFLLAAALWKFESLRRHQLGRSPIEEAEEYEQLPLDESEAESDSDGEGEIEQVVRLLVPAKLEEEGPQSGLARNDAERARGRVAFISSIGFIGFVWVLWIATAWRKLRG